MAQGFGDNSWVGFGVESTYGTPVARTTFFEFMSEGVKLDQGREARSSLRGRSRNRRGQKKHAVAGSIETQMQVNGMELLLKHAIGSDVITGTNPYTHTFSLTRALPVGLSLEVNRDSSNIGATSSFLYDGCQISKMTLKHAVGDFLKVTWDLVGEGDSSLVAVSTPTFAVFTGFDWPDFVCTINSVNVNVKSLDELVLDNNLATDRYNLGANKRKGLGGNGNRSISAKITVEFASLVELNYWRAQNNYAVSLQWSAVIAAQTCALTINFLNAEFTEGEPNVSDAGPITLQLAFDAYISSVEGDEIAVTLINTTATVP
jgi:hypothetical protein